MAEDLFDSEAMREVMKAVHQEMISAMEDQHRLFQAIKESDQKIQQVRTATGAALMQAQAQVNSFYSGGASYSTPFTGSEKSENSHPWIGSLRDTAKMLSGEIKIPHTAGNKSVKKKRGRRRKASDPTLYMRCKDCREALIQKRAYERQKARDYNKRCIAAKKQRKAGRLNASNEARR